MNLETMPGRGERGIALLMSMIVLFVVAVLALVLITSVQTDRKITSHDMRTTEAFNNAQAGIGEAIAQIRDGSAPNNTANPRLVTQVMLLAPGSTMPTYGTTDSSAVPTQQPAGQYLTYTTPYKSTNALTIAYKTDASRTVVYRYDPNLTNPVNTVSGYPIYTITSTGRTGGDRRKIVTEVFQKPVIASAKGALAANIDIEFKGTSDVCGYNHRIDTPGGTHGVHSNGGACTGYEVGSNDLVGGWSTSTITTGGAGTQSGSPSAFVQNQTGFFTGPWDMLNMTQSEFFSWIGPAIPAASLPSNPNGVYYVDNDNTSQNYGASIGLNGGAGEGLLYIDGDCNINGNFQYRGLIYLEGDLAINGTCWILGGVVARGTSTIKCANGTATILYSKDAIEQNIARYGGQFVTLSWRETNN